MRPREQDARQGARGAHGDVWPGEAASRRTGGGRANVRTDSQERDRGGRSRRSTDGGRQGDTRASRRQHESEQAAPFPRSLLEWAYGHRRFLIGLGIVVIVVLMLYGPTQRYYVAWRTQGDEQAKADALDADNENLRQDVNRLTTREGIEDEARRRGYAYPNEDSTNANDADENPNKGSDATDSGFSYADIEQPWFIHVLDFIFVYNGPSD